jgi:hypothetical protein
MNTHPARSLRHQLLLDVAQCPNFATAITR